MADAIYAAPLRAINPASETKLTPGWSHADADPAVGAPPAVGRGFMTAGSPDAPSPSVAQIG
ncbi:hypothetical protein [Aureimonas sp. AU22]|uniref:hypothetical protein n=1 Tax=Aureimonas sp. AU22 TaxID=1638162 RepID=UPI0007839EC3|nr:hypothetical protein [Aureimonas sp. AU22]